MTLRELDALIAEHFFDFQSRGLRVCRTVEELDAALHRKAEPWETQFLPLLADGLGIVAIPTYSRDMNLAMTVISEMQNRDWTAILVLKKGASCTFTPNKWGPEERGFHAPDPAEAICTAALLALGVEVEV